LARAGVKELAVGGCDAALLKLALAADEHLAGASVDVTRVLRQRARLAASQAYDLIVLAGEPMWMRGTGKAYGAGLFARCRSALAPGGLVALHVDGRALSARRFAAVTRDFARVFPNMQLWCTGAYDWLLVGSNGMIQSPADQMLACFERQPVMRDFARAGVLALLKRWPVWSVTAQASCRGLSAPVLKAGAPMLGACRGSCSAPGRRRAC
jgi:hypothetical protein